MKTEQIETITNKLQTSGFGFISKEDCRKLILLVQSELVLEAVFTPLDESEFTLVDADALVKKIQEGDDLVTLYTKYLYLNPEMTNKLIKHVRKKQEQYEMQFVRISMVVTNK